MSRDGAGPSRTASRQPKTRDGQKLETAKNELGLDHDETRSRHGWHRRVSLVMLALAMLALAMLVAIRRAANTLAPPESTPRMIRGTHR
jgi:SRSO17 transposase